MTSSTLSKLIWTSANVYSAYVELYPMALQLIQHGPAMRGIVLALRLIHQYV